MKLTQLPVLDQLAVDARCIGAAFTTFTFEPAFFENHVLAAILRIGADPDESAAAYHDEALATLQETPVVCFVDADMRTAGHQLPFDLREVRGRCFHPKVALLLYETGARLSVGSGNLTKAGYSGNAETFFIRNLGYDEPQDASVLRQVVTFFEALDRTAMPRGTQTSGVIDALSRRIKDTPEPTGGRTLEFLHTEREHGLLTQALDLLPPAAKITRIGILAPFFERDDLAVDRSADLSSVLMTLAARAGKDAVLDLGVSWEDASIGKIGIAHTAVRDGMNTLWAERVGEDASEQHIEYFVPTAETAGNYRFTDRTGTSRMESRDSVDAAIAEGTAWHVGQPQVFAPEALINAAKKCVKHVNIWLHPTPQLIKSTKVDRPLHAKVFTISFRSGNKLRTLVLIGSANASRMALLATPATGGNVEACLAFLVDDELGLADLAPELVHCSAPILWKEREFPELKPLPSIPLVESAMFDARAGTLTITWRPAEPAHVVAPWTLRYQDIELARGDAAPVAATVITPFRLSPSSCEVVVSAHDGECSFPIVVDDLTALPLGSSAASLDLRALLALVGRRLTPERHQAILAKHGPIMVDATLDALLGEGFAPTDVLRAWWAVATDLAQEGLTVAGFRLRLLGTIGAAAVWNRLRDLAGVPVSGLRLEEAWFYGAELRSALLRVEPAQGADRMAKIEVLESYLETLSAELKNLEPASTERPWLSRIVAFYQESRS